MFRRKQTRLGFVACSVLRRGLVLPRSADGSRQRPVLRALFQVVGVLACLDAFAACSSTVLVTDGGAEAGDGTGAGESLAAPVSLNLPARRKLRDLSVAEEQRLCLAYREARFDALDVEYVAGRCEVNAVRGGASTPALCAERASQCLEENALRAQPSVGRQARDFCRNLERRGAFLRMDAGRSDGANASDTRKCDATIEDYERCLGKLAREGTALRGALQQGRLCTRPDRDAASREALRLSGLLNGARPAREVCADLHARCPSVLAED